jgi:hypothetical protein
MELRKIRLELNRQTRFAGSVSQHAVFDAHRELFVQLLTNEPLLDIYAREAGLTTKEVQTKFFATLLINHARRVHDDLTLDSTLSDNVFAYILDAQEMFSFPFIRKRWEEVRTFHSKGFQTFIDKEILGAKKT